MNVVFVTALVSLMNKKLLVMNIALCHCNGEEDEYEAFSDEYCTLSLQW